VYRQAKVVICASVGGCQCKAVYLNGLMVAPRDPVQDDVRKVGGLSLLTSFMESLCRPKGVTDIYQLRVQVCLVLQRLLDGMSGRTHTQTDTHTQTHTHTHAHIHWIL
jgi:hypothetical protein